MGNLSIWEDYMSFQQ